MQLSKIQEDQRQEDEDARIVAATKSDPQAFGWLYDRYAPPIYHYLLSRLGNVEEARDVTSQTFLTAYEKFPGYRHRGYFSAWLFSIARSKCLDHLRRARVRDTMPDEPVEEILADPLVQVIEREQIAELKQQIQSLGEEERELLRLRYAAGLSFAELAALLGKKEDAVKKSLYRLLARMQQGCQMEK